MFAGAEKRLPQHAFLDSHPAPNQAWPMSMSRRRSFNHKVSLRKLLPLVFGAMILTGFLSLSRTAWAATTNTTASDDKAASLLRDYRSDIVLIKGKAGAGSGFVILLKGHKFLASNAHVMAGIRAPTFTPLDRSVLKFKPGAASVAVGHDILLLEVLEGGKGMPLVESFESEVAVNDPIAVYGNTGGSEVVTVINGKLLGIGPDRIEIDAEIEHGNSGSPIIHVRSGKVIGVATYALKEDLLSGEKKIRRFGYRLDTVKQWQPVDWVRFYAEADRLEKIQDTTTELKQAFLELNGLNQRSNKVRKYAYESPVIRDALDKFYTTLARVEDQREADRAINALLGALRNASQSGPTTVKPVFTYDFFRRQYTEQDSDRTELMKLFVKILQK